MKSNWVHILDLGFVFYVTLSRLLNCLWLCFHVCKMEIKIAPIYRIAMNSKWFNHKMLRTQTSYILAVSVYYSAGERTISTLPPPVL